MLRIAPVTTEEEFQQTWELVCELGRWDAEQSGLLGLDPQLVLDCFYAGDAATLRLEGAPPAGCFLLAKDDDALAGCAGFRGLDATACELAKVYVRRAFRGQGLARRMVEQLIAIARGAGYAQMRLETTPFMPEAQKLYRSLGFEPRDAYRPIPAVFEPWTLAMELALTRDRPPACCES